MQPLKSDLPPPVRILELPLHHHCLAGFQIPLPSSFGRTAACRWGTGESSPSVLGEVPTYLSVWRYTTIAAGRRNSNRSLLRLATAPTLLIQSDRFVPVILPRSELLLPKRIEIGDAGRNA